MTKDSQHRLGHPAAISFKRFSSPQVHHCIKGSLQFKRKTNSKHFLLQVPIIIKKKDQIITENLLNILLISSVSCTYIALWDKG